MVIGKNPELPPFPFPSLPSRMRSNVLGYNCLVLIQKYLETKKTVFLVCPNIYQASKYYDHLVGLLSPEQVLFYPGEQVLTRFMAIPSFELKTERLYTIHRLLQPQPYIVVCDQNAFYQYQLSPENYRSAQFALERGQRYDRETLIARFTANGFKRQYVIEKKEEFAVRGSIIDFYSLNHHAPIRLDFNDDYLERMKEFNLQTQSSVKNLDSTTIGPLNELFYQDNDWKKVKPRITQYFDKFPLSLEEQRKLEQDLIYLENHQMLGTLSIYLRFFTEADIFIQDYAPDSTVFIYDEPSFLLNDQNLKAELQAYHEKMHGNAFMGLQVQAPYQPKAEYCYFDIDAPTEVGLLTKPLNGGLSGLTRYLVEYLGQTVVLANPEPLIRQQIAQILDQAQFPYHENEFTPQSINLLDADYQVSFHDYRHQLVLIGPELYQQKTVKSRQVYRSVINQASKIHDVNEIKVGDYVVHFQYGIAKYLGITTMELSYGVADYLILEFSEEKQLYVLVDHLDQILKYVSYNGFEPKLSKLYSSGWTKTKFETIKKIKELSDKLLSLYARRNLVKRPPYVDVDLVNEVANTFEYDETPDQLKAIHEMQQDLSSEHPMDRLIIGDVGFGKTEVALRGAYRAVLSGKQVVYLVPTTVLARQHYLLFRQRLDPFGVKTVLYTRLVGAREQHEIEESLADGYCDIVIGTHKLLNEKMSYHQLGMMIIDEEQRFGVAQKIKINQLRPSLDVLSLSATPIPRTLQRSLVGVMDFSLIETPPTNRYPVQTYLLEEDDTITKGAILREMARGGQIFFLSNNTHRMELVMEQLKKLVPECRMTAIHGQMDKEDIEDRLSKFIDQEYDLLVSTTIIETGMDIPNANTLIVRNADRLGLAQMYQLRGRVGRSNKLAYAYFYYDKKQILSNASQLRLKSIEEFTELGSGYKIAYRDLSIRGAGDLLGSEQSGFIDSVGIELYNKLLQSTISQTPLEFNQERQNEPKYSSHSIASQYIKDDGVRLQIHQRIAKLGSLEEAKTMKEELTDRFGAISSNLNNYIDEIVYQKLLHRVGSSKVLVSQSQIEVNFSNDEQHRLDTKKMKEISRRWGNEADFVFIFGQYRLTLKHHGLDKSWMNQISGILEVYLDERTNILPS